MNNENFLMGETNMPTPPVIKYLYVWEEDHTIISSESDLQGESISVSTKSLVHLKPFTHTLASEGNVVS